MPVIGLNGSKPHIAKNVFIAPGAMIIGDVTIQEGASIWYNAVIRGDTAPIIIGPRTNIQDNCTLHVDADAPLTIGADCTIGHNAVVHGATLEDHVLVGMHATILSHARIGAETIIGAQALVSEHKEIPGSTLALGIPAKVVRPLKAEEYAQIRSSAVHYGERARQHKQAIESAKL
ncbi:gamma carbonic anhydrase family protein [Ktedonospora formicarum]|uniref:Gamma carbonic anhydrase family protein n=1 Tax=Ktedonospora formicarum TaxID=2778364 RepID=A0A8J3HYY9_9CHLR|nr:gamma carbonic anhydrase family protein [Ktedonospora formicarum]GHO43695.1 gamma carbonic anhydrase family protein [Ktedonospora formicarum]